MPVWELNELAVVVEMENTNLADLYENYCQFGGIIRYTLGSTRIVERASRELDARC